jgi:RNA polymerase sigma factor (sigma-70 family)
MDPSCGNQGAGNLRPIQDVGSGMDERTRRFDTLFHMGFQPVAAYVRRRVNIDEVDDVVVEVFTVAWRRLDEVPVDAALPWLYGVARRALANHRRSGDRRARLQARLVTERPADTPPPTSPAVEAALAVLKPGDQELLRLAAWEGLGPSEIAIALGCSSNAAALRLSRARARFRAALTRSEADRTHGAWSATDG